MGLREPHDGPCREACEGPVDRGRRDPQLPGGDGWLLGLHRHRRRYSHAGGTVLSPAGLFALRGGNAVPVLRVLRHRYQPGRRLAGGAYRVEPHHAHRHGHAGGGAIAAHGTRCLAFSPLCHGRPGPVRYRQGPEQDVGQGERQGAGRERWRVEAVPLGGGADRFQECPQGGGLFRRRGVARMDRLPWRLDRTGGHVVAGPDRDRRAAAQGRRQDEVEAEVYPGVLQYTGDQLALGCAVFPVRFA